MSGAGSAVPARDAATVVLLRDGARGPEALLLERTRSASFVPGAHVFPGGMVDPGDLDAAPLVTGISDAQASSLTGVERGGAAFWVAAVRECLEEAGVAPGLVPGGDGPAGDASGGVAPPEVAPGEAVAGWRRELHRGERPVAGVLLAAGVRIRAGALRCFARWVTPVGSPRRFDTRFFLAAVPEGAEVRPDGVEVVAHEWTTPAEALERFRRAELNMIMPTVRTLAALERFDSVAAALEGLRFGDPSQPLLPEMVERHGRRLVRLPADPEGNGGVYDGDTAMPLD